MIKDHIKNFEKYASISLAFQKAFEFLRKKDLINLPTGRYEIDGDNIYVNIDEYETKISDNVESHKKYIDIQYLIKGEENIGVASPNNLKIIEEYNDEKDIVFYNGDTRKIKIKENEFVIFYPEDAHLPCQIINFPQKVKKAVVKIKNNLQ